MPLQPVRKLIQNLKSAEELLRDNRDMKLFGQADELKRLAKSIGELARRCVAANRR